MVETGSLLFVEDDRAQRLALALLFEQAGFEVRVATTGHEALQACRERVPDLVVLDVNLPDLDGFEVCRRIKQPREGGEPNGHLPPTVVMTSAVYVGSGDRTHGLEDGADAYLVKPVEPRELLATLRSLQRLRSAELAAHHAAQQWRATFDAIRDIVCLVGHDGRLQRCNWALCALVRRTFADLLGRPLGEVLAEGLGLGHPPPLPLGADAPDRQSAELQLGPRWFRVNADPFPSVGAAPGWVIILTDITQRKALEEQLRQAQKMDAIGRLAGGVAHDYNNLLTVILGNATLLLGQLPGGGPEHGLVSAVERAAWRAAELTRRLLGFARQTLLWLETTDLSGPLVEVQRLVERMVPGDVTFEVRRATGLWQVQADPGQLTQVLLNLCVNALDAMSNGGRLVMESSNVEVHDDHTRANHEARPGAFVRLRVSDTGHGIAPEVRPRIFEPFFTTKPVGQGTGLGLAMVHGIVKQHQGWIECHSEPDRGARFDIYLPRAHGAALTTARPVPMTMARPGGTERILVADDNDLLRHLLGTQLRQHGFHVVEADGAGAVLAALREEGPPPHLLVVDRHLLGAQPEGLLGAVEQSSPGLPVLMLAGAETEATPSWPQVRILVRPYREHVLLEAVRSALGG